MDSIFLVGGGLEPYRSSVCRRHCGSGRSAAPPTASVECRKWAERRLGVAGGGGIVERIYSTFGPELRDEFHRFGELLTELFKLAALLVFGALISPTFLIEISPSGYLFAILVLLFVRPIALGIALIGSRLSWPEMATTAWFGPKGFASVAYGILIFKADLDRGDELFHLLAIVVAGSIIAHSSTDVVIAQWFQKAETDSSTLFSSTDS